MANTICGLIGVVIGGFLGHWLAGIRDSAARKRNFIGFLERWKSEISAPNRGPTIIDVSIHPAIKAYDSKVGIFREQIAIVRDVFSGSHRFETLTIRLANLKTQDWDKKNPRDVILDAIERLSEFCK